MNAPLSHTVLQALAEANLAAVAAIAFVLIVRKPVIRLLGAGAAYLMWAVVPAAMLATLLPARTLLIAPAMETDNAMVAATDAFMANVFVAQAYDWSLAAPALLLIWISGAAVLAALLIRRQLRFMSDVTRGEAGPAVVGFWRPRIVTPSDFAQRFSPLEQRLIMAHEQVHLERNDTRINAGVALLRCLCWFNPLVHVGARILRADQEMSCDAAVVSRRPLTRRAYAETLLKTQLASRALPVGCYWPPAATHPLTDRIGLLTRRPFSDERRLASATAIAALVAGAGALAWMLQPARLVETEPFIQLADAANAMWPYAEAEQTIFILSATAPAPDDPPASVYAMSNGDGVKPPSGMPHPPYPAEAMQRGEQGEVTASLCVSATGTVDSVKLIRSSESRTLDDAAMQALTSARLQPATRNGAPLAVCDYMISFQWSLDGGPGPTPGANRTD